MEALLRWLKVGGHGYTPSCAAASFGLPHPSPLTQTCPAYADDLAIISFCPARLRIQFEKIQRYCTWGGLTLNAKKCAVTGILHHAALTGLAPSLTDQTKFLRQRLEGKLTLRQRDGASSPIPFYPPDKPYQYLGIWLTMNLDFRPHFDYIVGEIKKKQRQLIMANIQGRQALHIIQYALKPKICYSFSITPFSLSDISFLDSILIQTARTCMRIGKNFPNKLILCPTDRGGIGLTSLLADYVKSATQTLTCSLNDDGDLGMLTKAMLNHQIKTSGRRFPTHRAQYRSETFLVSRAFFKAKSQSSSNDNRNASYSVNTIAKPHSYVK